MIIRIVNNYAALVRDLKLANKKKSTEYWEELTQLLCERVVFRAYYAECDEFQLCNHLWWSHCALQQGIRAFELIPAKTCKILAGWLV